MLAEIAELNDDHKKFYEQFVMCLKLGIHENSVDDSKIAELLRSDTSKSGDERTQLKEYVDRMNGDPSDIYSIIGESIAAVSSSSVHGILCKKSLEVLHMVGSVEEWVCPATFQGAR